MVLPTLAPSRGILRAVGRLPMHKQSCITNGNSYLQFTGKVSSLTQTGVAAWCVEAWSSLKGNVDFIRANFEPNADTRIGVVAHPDAVRLPSLAVLNRKEHAIEKITETISEPKVDIAVAKSPENLGSKLIFQTLNIIAFIFSDVIRLPIN